MQTSPRPIEIRASHAISHATPVARRDRRWQPVADALSAVVARARRGSVYAELNALTDRELSDIGLTRGEIRRVNDPEFCAARLLRAR